MRASRVGASLRPCGEAGCPEFRVRHDAGGREGRGGGPLTY